MRFLRIGVTVFVALFGLIVASVDSEADSSNVISIWKPVTGIITSYPGAGHEANAFDIDGYDGEAAYVWAVNHPFGTWSFAAYISNNYLRSSMYRNNFGQNVWWNDRFVGFDVWHTEYGVWVGPVSTIGNLHLSASTGGPSVGTWAYDGWFLGNVDTIPSNAQLIQWQPGYPCYGTGAYFYLWISTPGCSQPYSSGSHVHWSGDQVRANWPLYRVWSGNTGAWMHSQGP